MRIASIWPCRAPRDSDDRGRAAQFAAEAFLAHDGPQDEQAALYATLINFLDDASVKVRAALAYALLHSPNAPRPIMLALLQDSPVVARAVAQYSPVLLESDLNPLIPTADEHMLDAIVARPVLAPSTVSALLERGIDAITLMLLAREDVRLSPQAYAELAQTHGQDARMRGALLKRKDLPASARMALVDKASAALMQARIVKGAIQPRRLERLMRDATDGAITEIGERDVHKGRGMFVESMVVSGRVSTRLMVHALVCGHVLFFASCLARLAEMPREKVYTLLDRGSRPALTALLSRCGFSQAVGALLSRLILYARAANLADDLAARHFVVTVTIEDMIAEHRGSIPAPLTELFGYLNEQNITLARHAARGVMASFAESADGERPMRVPAVQPEPLALTAA